MKINCQSYERFNNNIDDTYDELNTNFVLQHFISCYVMIYAYHINYLRYTNSIAAQFFRALLFYMKPDTINISISGITDRQL